MEREKAIKNCVEIAYRVGGSQGVANMVDALMFDMLGYTYVQLEKHGKTMPEIWRDYEIDQSNLRFHIEPKDRMFHRINQYEQLFFSDPNSDFKWWYTSMEEQLYVDDTTLIYRFLEWVCDGNSFGSANFRQRVKEYCDLLEYDKEDEPILKDINE